ncbi:MAG: hypothetical protein ACD_38C00146G0001 [uncultured bacterium]|nr:MAG: hypothetical protein ACD_38C00146G0001 [uncultured bacterium]
MDPLRLPVYTRMEAYLLFLLSAVAFLSPPSLAFSWKIFFLEAACLLPRYIPDNMKENLEFLVGHVYKGPEEMLGGKFVRIGKLLVVTPDPMIDHPVIICPKGWVYGEKNKFADVIERLKKVNSPRVDAGYIRVLPEDRSINIWDDSWKLKLPVNDRARNVTAELLGKYHQDYSVETRRPRD